MTRAEFLRALEKELLLPDGSLKEGQSLSDIPAWDSMAAVQFIALADEKVGIIVADNDIAKSKTVNDLLTLLGDRLTA